MAQRRMFSLQIVDTDAFMNMPLSTQALYFHLGMRADDDGFVSNARRVQKLVGASDDDLNLLLLRRFVLAFESGVMVIKHWKISNYIQKDRYRPTLYKEEKATLFLKADGAYTDHPVDGAKPLGTPAAPALPAPVSSMDTTCIHRVGEDRKGEDRVGEDRLGDISSGGGDTRARTRESAEKEVDEYLQDRQLDPTFTFGVTEQLLGDVALLTEAIFKKFTTRRPTEADVANVFMNIRHQEYDEDNDRWNVTLPQERRSLLMYAFEQASNAGKPGDWKYINGVLAKLHQRGITTMDAAEDYETERAGGV